jgi:hypothetical protein
VTPDTVFLNHFNTGLFDKNVLWFQSQCEHCCVTGTIFGFEEIFAKKIIMWHMAIIAIRFFAV